MTTQNQTSTPYLMGTACAGLFTFGVMTSFLGATLPELSARSGFDLARSGTLFSFLYFPQVPMVFLAGPLIDRFGKKLVLAAGLLCSAAALVGMAYAPSYAVLGALLVMLGLGGCSAMAASNTLIPDLYPANPSSALNLGGIFFGVGAVFFPWLVALMARRLGLVATLWSIAVLVGLVAMVALAQRFPPASMAGGFDWDQAKSLVINPAVIILACVLFFYSALEVSTAGWIRTFLEKDLAATSESSKIILACFWIMMMLGRLIASQVVKRVRGPQLLLGCSVGAIAGLTLMALAPNVLDRHRRHHYLRALLRAGISHHGGNRLHLLFANLWNRLRLAHDSRLAERRGGSTCHRLRRPASIGARRHLDPGGHRVSVYDYAGNLQPLRAAAFAPRGARTGVTGLLPNIPHSWSLLVGNRGIFGQEARSMVVDHGAIGAFSCKRRVFRWSFCQSRLCFHADPRRFLHF